MSHMTMDLEPAASPLASAPPWLKSEADAERDRRLHERLTPGELDWLRSVRLKFGPSVSLVDLSAGGVLIESSAPLRPGQRTELTLIGRGLAETATLRVLRCEVVSVNRGLVYRGACEFERPLTLPIDAGPRPARPGPDGRSAPAKRAEPVVAVALAAPPPVVHASIDAPVPSPVRTEPAASGWTRLVVRYLDGRLLKGFSQDFHPSRPHFHLTPIPTGMALPPMLVPIPMLKAVFFVRDFEGDSTYVERRSFVEPLPGRRIEVTFMDDEVIVGATLGYRPDGTGFFVTPADTSGNNIRVFVVPAGVRHIRYL